MASKLLTTDQQNFVRIGIAVVDEIKLPMKDLFEIHIKPVDLYNAISSWKELLTGRYQLSADQLKICYLPPPDIPDYGKFDVTLLYKLIRNLCQQIVPTQGWGKEPKVSDVKIGDDIERLRGLRNDVFGHVESSSIPDGLFEKNWKELENIMKRMDAFFIQQGIKAVNYEKKLADIKLGNFGIEDMEKYKTFLEATLSILKHTKHIEFPKIAIRGDITIMTEGTGCFEADIEHTLKCTKNWPITWHRVRGNNIEQIDTSTEKYTDSTSSRLVIQRVSREDHGEYQAIISGNSNGQHIKIPSNVVTLKVTGGKDQVQLNSLYVQTDEQVMVREGMSFVEYQSNMVSLAKKIAMTTQEMVSKAEVNPTDLGRLANQLTRDYDILASNSANAAATASGQDESIANRIRTTVQDLGKSCVELVQDAGKVQGDPHDTFARKDLQDHARSVSEKVSFVLAALQSGSRGTQACINAASAVSGIIADLDTTIMFVTAGTLSTEGDDSFASLREDILKTAKALVEEAKKLVQGAASDQETLTGAAQQAVKTITKLADVVKVGAASLGSDQPEAQVMIINAVKDAVSALSDLISATKNASGKNVSDPEMLTLKESAKATIISVTSLLKTVKTVEDEAARGIMALESTIEAIGQEIKSYEAGTLPEKKSTAEDLIRLTKPITMATAEAVAAGNSTRQEDVIICANMGRKAIFDLLATCRGTASTAETTEVRQKTIHAGKSCAVVYKDLLEQVSVVVQKPSQESKQTLVALSRQVAISVQEVVLCAELIKGTDLVDPEHPTVIAESELLTAAKSIEAAAQKLSQLKPRKKAKEADMSLNFQEQIVEAAKSVASDTAALVKSASAVQREFMAQRKVCTRREISARYHSSQILDDDGEWSEGLISPAKLVAAATHSLCESANAMVQDRATEDLLISSAKVVAGSTAHLLVACRVKADPNSVAMKKLQVAGNAVKQATEVLVKAAQQAKQRDKDEEIDVAVDPRKIGGIKLELQFQEEMLRKEREWIEAREKLAKFRKQRYKDAPHDSDSSSAF